VLVVLLFERSGVDDFGEPDGVPLIVTLFPLGDGVDV
jgi:hypothetical protein